MDTKAQSPNLLFTKLLFGLEPKSISMTCGSCDLEGIKEPFSSPSFGFGRFCKWSWCVWKHMMSVLCRKAKYIHIPKSQICIGNQKKKNLKYAFNVNLVKILYVVLNPKITIILELHSFTHHFLQLSYVTDWVVEKKWWVQVIAYSDSNKLLYRRVVVKSVWKSIVLEFL